MTSYSQLGQDLKVLEFYKFKKNGYFIEAGAHDGKSLSNTKKLEDEYGWKGICAEPLPYLFEQLKANRPNSICSDRALYNESDLTLLFDITHNLDMLSSIKGIADKTAIHSNIIRNNISTINVKTITLIDLLDQSNAPSFIEYLSLDTEGSEYNILKVFDFTKYTFGLIDVEHNYVEPVRNDIRKLLTSNGYIYIGENQWDDSYMHISNQLTFYIAGREYPRVGLFSLFMGALGIIDTCIDKKHVPIIDFTGHEYCNYYQKNLILPNGKKTENIWEYYFEQPTNKFTSHNFTFKNIDAYQNVIKNSRHPYVGPSWNKKIDYHSDSRKHYSKLVKTIKVHDYILEDVNKYIDKNFKSLRVMAINIRTTDKLSELRAEGNQDPYSFSIETYVIKINELFVKYKLDKIFVCTETTNVVLELSKVFGDKCIYRDCFRSDDNNPSHTQINSRENHHYKLGLEVITDCLLMSKCTGILCWKSNVGDCAIYFSDSNYEFVEYMA